MQLFKLFFGRKVKTTSPPPPPTTVKTTMTEHNKPTITERLMSKFAGKNVSDESIPESSTAKPGYQSKAFKKSHEQFIKDREKQKRENPKKSSNTAEKMARLHSHVKRAESRAETVNSMQETPGALRKDKKQSDSLTAELKTQHRKVTALLRTDKTRSGRETETPALHGAAQDVNTSAGSESSSPEFNASSRALQVDGNASPETPVVRSFRQIPRPEKAHLVNEDNPDMAYFRQNPRPENVPFVSTDAPVAGSHQVSSKEKVHLGFRSVPFVSDSRPKHTQPVTPTKAGENAKQRPNSPKRYQLYDGPGPYPPGSAWRRSPSPRKYNSGKRPAVARPRMSLKSTQFTGQSIEPRQLASTQPTVPLSGGNDKLSVRSIPIPQFEAPSTSNANPTERINHSGQSTKSYITVVENNNQFPETFAAFTSSKRASEPYISTHAQTIRTESVNESTTNHPNLRPLRVVNTTDNPEFTIQHSPIPRSSTSSRHVASVPAASPKAPSGRKRRTSRYKASGKPLPQGNDVLMHLRTRPVKPSPLRTVMNASPVEPWELDPTLMVVQMPDGSEQWCKKRTSPADLAEGKPFWRGWYGS